MDEQKLDANDLESMSGGLIVKQDDSHYYVVRDSDGKIGAIGSSLAEARYKATGLDADKTVISVQEYKEKFGKDFNTSNRLI